MALQELEKAEKWGNTNYRFGSLYEGPIQDCRECIPVKEVVGNLSAKVVGQTEQKLVEACDLIRLLLPYGQKKSENSAYVTTTWANGVRVLVVVQNHVVKNKISKASTYTKG